MFHTSRGLSNDEFHLLWSNDVSQQSYVTIYKNAFLFQIEEILHLKDQYNI